MFIWVALSADADAIHPNRAGVAIVDAGMLLVTAGGTDFLSLGERERVRVSVSPGLEDSLLVCYSVIKS